MDFIKNCVALIILFSVFEASSALECYVCSNQSANTQKCLNTIKTCEPDEDVCKTEIRWGSTPYWDFGAPKQFYVSKTCATKKKCQAIRSKYMPYCTHIWYEDWSCSECCLGDRCNYYVISSSNIFSASVWTLISVNMMAFIISKLI
ncbi:CLUMA_CG004792, isoform A [Clunio marinus]|uniref:CLUMA_CG004792, isoform A n=1 Tax=Clunio marinus TaxID=568069 RepID=A0A1J1HSQ6_9DIPT|nr:CLUMA_CG004792, isoform A [Clunio marinus]